MIEKGTMHTGSQSLRPHVLLIVAELDTGLGFHFCAHSLLSGSNNNLWFPLEDENTLFAMVEKVMVMNHAAHNVTDIERIHSGDQHVDYKVTYNPEVRVV